MIKNSSEYLDVKELVDFVLEYGKDNSLPNMEGSGEAAYQAALRLQQHGLPKAYDAKHSVKQLVAYASGNTNQYDDMVRTSEEFNPVLCVINHDDLLNIETEIRSAYEAGYQAANDGVTIEESLHTVHRREDLYDDDYGDCTRLHCGAFVVDLYYRSGNRELAESSIGVFNAETVLDDEGLHYETA